MMCAQLRLIRPQICRLSWCCWTHVFYHTTTPITVQLFNFTEMILTRCTCPKKHFLKLQLKFWYIVSSLLYIQSTLFGTYNQPCLVHTVSPLEHTVSPLHSSRLGVFFLQEKSVDILFYFSSKTYAVCTHFH